MARDRSRLLALNIAAALSAVVSATTLDARTTATAEQCMATARGLSGNCQPNPWVLDTPRPPPRRARR